MEQASERALLIAQEIAQRTATDHYRMILNEQRVPDATGSKIGGKPYWPVGMQYPVDMKGNKMLFVMQVNCEEAGFKSPLPESGMLQWFISMNTERMYGCLGNYNEDGSGFAIVYHGRIGECGTLTEVPTHDSIDDDMLSPVKREVAIDIVAESTTMGVSDGRFNRLFFDIIRPFLRNTNFVSAQRRIAPGHIAAAREKEWSFPAGCGIVFPAGSKAGDNP